MIINHRINTDISICCLEDLKKLKPLIENTNLKVNKSALARELGVDRRTVAKYIDGYARPKTRNRASIFDEYYDLIRELLSPETADKKNKIFFYKRDLWQYLTDNYGLKCAQSSFRRYISSVPEFEAYFNNNRTSSVKTPAPSRFETAPGEQAQLDWKESINFVLKTGEVIVINIFVLILSYSRFRVYRLSLTKTQDVLLHFMDEAFETFGGVPKEILTDNMKTVMDEARTEYSAGKVNSRFSQYADDYGFTVHPCIARRANTKAKVESPMKILDELRAYSGDLDYTELCAKLAEINDRENARFHESYSGIPLLYLEKEKGFLSPLPNEKIRNHYCIATDTVKVNRSSMISYRSNQYSVPPEYIGKILQIQVYDNWIHLYYNTDLVAVHSISSRKLNYLEGHYIEIMGRTLPFESERIAEIAKENLRIIGERYDNNTRAAASEPEVSENERDGPSSQ